MELPYNLFYFMFFAGYMPFLLYLPVYFKYLGLSAVYIGLLNGIRPILQAVGTPFLVKLGEKFHARKLLFVISCLIMIGKVLIILLQLRPSHQLCTINSLDNKSKHSVKEVSLYFVEHGGLFKHTSITTLSNKKEPEANVTFIYSMIRKEKSNGDGGNFKNKSRKSTLNRQSQRSTIRKLSSHVYQKNYVSHITAPPAESHVDMTQEYFVINDDDEHFRIFISLLMLAFFGDSFDATVFTLVDHSIETNVDSKRYGFVRLWGNIGWGLTTPVIGWIVYHFDHVLCGKIVGSFHYIFFFFVGFIFFALIIGLNLDFTSTLTDVVTTKANDPSSNFRYGLLLFVMSYSCFCNGFLLTFVNCFIDSLGGNASIMGIANGCKCIVDVLLFFLLTKVMDNIGHQLVLNIGLIGHVGVFLGYLFIKEPWLVVLAESFHGIVYAMVSSACLSFMLTRAPAGSSPHKQVMLQGIYWGFGTGFGSIFGGYNLDRSNFPETFVILVVITSIVAVVFSLLEIFSYLSDDKGTLDRLSSESTYSSSFDSDDEDDDDLRDNFEDSRLYLMRHNSVSQNTFRKTMYN